MAYFSRTTIVEAVALFDNARHSDIDRLLLRFGLEEDIPDRNSYLRERANAIAAYLIEHPDEQGPNGSNLTFEIIEELAQDIPDPDEYFWDSEDRYSKLRNSLSRDGYRVENGKLKSILPDAIDLPGKESELETLLNRFGFSTSRGHLDQAIAAHTRGEWASANAQLRSFIESLFDEIANQLIDQTQLPSTSHRRRELLATIDPPFFMTSLNEWQIGNNGGFVQGFWRRLHPQGSHPGLSDETDCTFRLHLVVLVGHHFLKRFEERA